MVDQTHPGYWELLARLALESEELWTLFCVERGATGCETVEESATGVTVRAYFDRLASGVAEAWRSEFSAVYPEVAPPEDLRVRHCEGQDWQQAWRVHFRPTPAGERLVICPPWDVPESGRRKPVVIEPGQGFGTGGHASTLLALVLLEQCVPVDSPVVRMVDVGTGSGILALAAMHLGVPKPLCVDIDPLALPEVRRNALLNGFSKPPPLVCGTPGCVRGEFSLVTANLTAPILLEELDPIADLTSPGGRLILSGMLVRERNEVLAGFAERGFRAERTVEREDWGAACLIRSH